MLPFLYTTLATVASCVIISPGETLIVDPGHDADAIQAHVLQCIIVRVSFTENLCRHLFYLLIAKTMCDCTVMCSHLSRYSLVSW